MSLSESEKACSRNFLAFLEQGLRHFDSTENPLASGNSSHGLAKVLDGDHLLLVELNLVLLKQLQWPMVA